MPEIRGSVLVVDDEHGILKTMGICFESLGFEVHLFSRPIDAIDAFTEREFDLAFIDLKMSPLTGMEVLAELKRRSPATTAVIITAHGSIDSAVEAIKMGAFDYLKKPFDFTELQIFVEKVWDHHKLNREVRALRTQLSLGTDDGEIVTRNRTMRELIALARRVADSTISVLLEGESGTGKELFAQLIHASGNRSNRKFVRVNCAALPEQLLESELFGHVKGAFTGAVRDREGRFQIADGGTIFLDEISEISPSIQVKLLRVLQQKEFEALGDSVTRTVDVRVIAATNSNLDEALTEGTFRQDLFYRLNSVRIRVPPLRERPDDIPLLTQHFLRKYEGEEALELSDEALRALCAYRWSGNVRELEHVIERAVLFARGGMIHLSELPEEVRTSTEKPAHELSLEEVERLHIKKVLQHAKDYDEAARILAIDPATLWRKRKKFGF